MACSSYSSIFGNPNSAILSPRSPCSHTFSPKFSSISFNSHPSLSFRFNQFATPHYSRIHHRYHRSNFVVMTFAGNSKPLRTMISGAPASGKGIQSELITEKRRDQKPSSWRSLSPLDYHCSSLHTKSFRDRWKEALSSGTGVKGRISATRVSWRREKMKMKKVMRVRETRKEITNHG
ncbi:Adenylate kinase 2 chloroplastic [Bienertia sinuspersici]